jgi:hypothetical protein
VRVARILQDPQEFEYGEKEVTVIDPAGHRWQFTQSMRDGAPGVGRLLGLTQMPKPAGPRRAAGVCAYLWRSRWWRWDLNPRERNPLHAFEFSDV